MYTEAIEDYLRAIYQLEQLAGQVTTSALAARLGVAPASVTHMVKKLAARELIEYRPYRAVSLTRLGQKVALRVIRRHRLVELYLIERLGVPREQARAYADRWEHVLSDDVGARMDAALGNSSTPSGESSRQG